MKKIALLLTLIVLTSFAVHKFYVSIYQINFNEKQKRIEITSRIFVDDLNTVLSKKYNLKTNIGDSNETVNDVELMKKYLAEKMLIKVNNEQKKFQYLSKEMDGHSLVCYFKIEKISNIKSFEIENTALFELSSKQQNDIQTKIYGKKESQLLTVSNEKMLINIK